MDTKTGRQVNLTNFDDSVFKGQRSKEEVIKALEEKEGCRVMGTVDLHIMNTMIQIRLSNPFLTEQIRHHYDTMNRSSEFVQDLSHTINSLVFGNHTEDNKAIM